MAQRVMTLYLEDRDIKLVIARDKQVEVWASVPLDAGLIEGGLIIDEEQVAGKVRELINSIKNIRGFASVIGRGREKVIVGLSGRDSLYRVLSLPILPDDMLTEAVNREAARILPVPLDELYIAYQRIPSDINQSLVFVAAFPKKTTDTLLRTLRSAGVTPRVLDLAPLALCSSVNEPRAVLVDVNIRSDNLNIVVINERVPQVIRSLSLQSEIDTLSDNMPTISEELARTIAFYNSSHPNEQVDAEVPIFVSGDLLESPDLWPELVGGINSEVAVLPSVMEYPEGFPLHEYLINLGLAAKELHLEEEPGNYSMINLNALPDLLMPKAFNIYKVIAPAVAVIGLASIVFLWFMWQNNVSETESIEAQLATLQEQIISNSQSIADITEENRLLRDQIQGTKDVGAIFVNKINDITELRELANSDLHTFIELKPTEVVVTGVDYTDLYTTTNVLNTIAGFSYAYQNDLYYARGLRGDGGYNVVVSSINYNPEFDKDTKSLINIYEFLFEIQ